MKFEDLKLSKFLYRGLQEAGFEEPTPIQSKAIPKILAGQDLLAVAPTGTGKTLAYLLPMLRELGNAKGVRPRALILVPTKELALQINSVIEKITCYVNIRSMAAYGGGSKQDQMFQLEQGVDIVVATAGRLQEFIAIRSFKPTDIKHFVVDEADTMMDQNFFPQLELILNSLPERRRNIFCSATFSHETQAIANNFLVNPAKVIVSTIATPPANIEQMAYDVPNIKTKLNLLADLVNDTEEYKKVIVFTESKKVADRSQQFLHHRFFEGKTNVIHSNKSENYRIRQVEEFRRGEASILIATSVAAKGLDFEDISHVINFEVPQDYEEYVHRIGRTGRNGKSGKAVSFVAPEEQIDFDNINQLLGQNTPLSPLPEDTFVIEMEVRTDSVEKEGNSLHKKNLKKNALKIEGGEAFHEKKEKNRKENRRIKALPDLSAKAKKQMGLKSNGRPRKRRK